MTVPGARGGLGHTPPRLPRELPAPRVPDSKDAPPLRWGVLGTGWIAERFVASLQAHTRQQVVAVGSRARSTAQDFARRFDVPRAHGSYEQLATDPEVDVLYVATPHNLHHPHAAWDLRSRIAFRLR